MTDCIRFSPTKTCERCTGRIASVSGGATPPTQFDNKTLRIAVTEWLDDPDNAKAKYGHISNWDTTNVTNMTRLFQKKGDQFNEPLNDWNTQNVTNMFGMFSFARSFNQPLHKWDTGQVTEMNGMFFSANQFNQPLNNWNTSQVTNMMGMFYFAHKFNQPLDNWNTSNVKIMSRMFFGAISFNQPLNKWDTSHVQVMNCMFSGARRFNQPLSDWNTSRVTDMEEMFWKALRFNQPLHRWDTSQVANMHNVFKDAPLMLARYPDGKLPPNLWQQVRDRGIRDRQHRRWYWQVRCDVNRNVSHEVLRRWANEYGIQLHDPNTQRPKTKRALCVELAQLWDAQKDAQMDTHRAVHPTCHNPTGILGENMADIPPEFFYHYTHDDGLVYCDDIRSLHKHVNLSDSPQNPYNRQPYSPVLVDDINTSYDRLDRRVVHLVDFDYDDLDNVVAFPFEARFSQKLAALMLRLIHPAGPERLRDASADVWDGFLVALWDEEVLSDRQLDQVDAQPGLDQQKFFLVELLVIKIDNDPNQIDTAQGRLSQIAVSVTDVYNHIFGE
jgi:surface protein